MFIFRRKAVRGDEAATRRQMRVLRTTTVGGAERPGYGRGLGGVRANATEVLGAKDPRQVPQRRASTCDDDDDGRDEKKSSAILMVMVVSMWKCAPDTDAGQLAELG
uniref:Uncharacterized protein n=1 Tax=Mycena chlorophos TaxID=658473 RepID=A0ABQ0LT04_MYCCL|nr:predicted protein [Mycena chlorophos]